MDDLGLDHAYPSGGCLGYHLRDSISRGAWTLVLGDDSPWYCILCLPLWGHGSYGGGGYHMHEGEFQPFRSTTLRCL
jgi:hypothetical protein